MVERKTVCIVTGTRAEYGLLKPLIDMFIDDNIIELRLVVTGSHLSAAFGETYREIEDDGYHIDAKIEIALDSDTHGDMARSTGIAVVSFANYFENRRPDMLVLLGDRFELLAAAVAASMQLIPISHIAGGDTSEGAVDEFIRHAITKMSYLHFPTNENSRKRVMQLGEAPERVFNVGALNVDNIISRQLLTLEELSANLNFDFNGEYALVTFHPVTMHEDNNASEFIELLRAVEQFPDIKFLFSKANADSGGRAINGVLETFVKKNCNCAVFASLGNLRYLSAMKHACMVIGNSSSGLYETPSFGVPCVNIGDRQRGRFHADNVIDCTPKTEAIVTAISKAHSREFQTVSKNIFNPFGDGHAAERITEKIKFFLTTKSIDLKKAFYSTY